MISPETLRRFSVFAGLSAKQLNLLAKSAEEKEVPEEHWFFHEEEELHTFYLLLEGHVKIVLELPARDVSHRVAEQLTRQMETDAVVVSDISVGDLFGWSALLPPHEATAGGKTTAPSRVVAFDGEQLRRVFEENPEFAYVMMQKVADVMRGRLKDMRLESLAQMAP
jgi:CRP-like cAMP-binding protein